MAATEIRLPHGWVPCTTNGGRVYFADHNTRETFWELPKNYVWEPADPEAAKQGQAQKEEEEEWESYSETDEEPEPEEKRGAGSHATYNCPTRTFLGSMRSSSGRARISSSFTRARSIVR